MRTNVKRACQWMIAIGLFIAVGFLIVGQGYAEGHHRGPTCTLHTLKGRYLFCSCQQWSSPPRSG